MLKKGQKLEILFFPCFQIENKVTSMYKIFCLPFMIEATKAYFLMVVVGMKPMPLKNIGGKTCLQARGPFKLSKDLDSKGAQTF